MNPGLPPSQPRRLLGLFSANNVPIKHPLIQSCHDKISTLKTGKTDNKKTLIMCAKTG